MVGRPIARLSHVLQVGEATPLVVWRVAAVAVAKSQVSKIQAVALRRVTCHSGGESGGGGHRLRGASTNYAYKAS